MNLANVLFYFLSVILVMSALQVVMAKNQVQAVLFLVLSFVTSSCLWLTLNIEFLALTLILVYVGAVMVLFLFVVMMLDIDVEAMRRGFWKNLPLALVLGVVVLAEMVFVLLNNLAKPTSSYTEIALDDGLSNSNALGFALYNQFPYPVELASMVLLLGLVVAVALTLRKAHKNAKYQNIAKQVATRANSSRMELIEMKAESEIDIPTTESVDGGAK